MCDSRGRSTRNWRLYVQDMIEFNCGFCRKLGITVE